MLEPSQQIATIARDHPSTVRVFQRHGIDFCCGGKRPLSEVCDERGLSSRELLQELEEACAAPEPEDDWNRASLGKLSGHIVRRYHGALRRELPLLGELAVKVADRHGDRHPELLEVRDLFQSLRDEMFQHMAKEEEILFPLIERMEGSAKGEGFQPPVAIDGPVAAMEDDHEQVARILARMRSLTTDFTPPDTACNSYRGLYQGLSDLEADTHVHIHLENNVLFPRAQELVERLEA
ncbi:MAG: iron-sulfur cluster repair di-iron protein [Thermoanaerobaculia bacterium]|nr:iron-sulfur cluster repair di-iron protein [Thermoanaerobaculia bacterium]